MCYFYWKKKNNVNYNALAPTLVLTLAKFQCIVYSQCCNNVWAHTVHTVIFKSRGESLLSWTRCKL